VLDVFDGSDLEGYKVLTDLLRREYVIVT
jgi:hypothetical protein